jgi:hypothetical protein
MASLYSQVVQLLADELLRSKGGRPLAVRHLDDAAGPGAGQLAVQLQVRGIVDLCCAALCFEVQSLHTERPAAATPHCSKVPPW